MSRIVYGSLLAGLFALCLGCGPDGEAQLDEVVDVAAVPTSATALETAAAGEHRSAENRARDVYRHPAETLAFFGLEPDLSVVEIWPGGGWYTEILAPYLREQGSYYAAGLDPESESEFAQRSVARFEEKLASDPELYDRTIVTALAPGLKIAPDGSADLVLTFRNVHNWMSGDLDEVVFQAMFDALKPGGVLGVVEHRGDPTIEQDPKAENGYVRQDYAIALAEAIGFELVAASEINANPNDTKDYPDGVWTLPPTYRLEDLDREQYAAIGESDRMTLKFRKPELGDGP
jgi:predicted methyltransferase